MKKFVISFILAILTVAFAQINSWQPFQPFKQNYLNRAGGASTLVYQLDLYDGDLTAEVGSDPTFVRASTRYYYDQGDESSLATVSSGNPAFQDPPFVDATNQGLYFAGATKNEILQSEAPATWTTVGSPTSVNNSVGTWGSLSYGSIVAAASGDGITQTSARAAVSESAVFSVWMAASTGTATVTLTIEGVGATPETATKDVIVTTTPRRYWIFNSFTAAATGNIKVDITTNAADTIYVAGMQLEVDYSPNGSYAMENYPRGYIPTTTTAATGPSDILKLPNDTIPLSAGSFIAWVNWDLPTETMQTSPSQQLMPHILWVESSSGGAVPALVLRGNLQSGAPLINFRYNNLGVDVSYQLDPSNNITWSSWRHIALTWDHDGSDLTYNVYVDGASIGGSTTTVAVPTKYASGNPERIGGLCLDGGTNDYAPYNSHLNISGVKIHNKALSATQIQTDFDNTKSGYANNTYRYGYPADNRYESGVVGQFIFEASSGNETDVQGAVTLAPEGAGSLTYSVSASGAYSNLGPGITTSSTAWLEKETASSSWNIGTSDAVIEFWLATTDTSTTAKGAISTKDTTNDRGYQIGISPGGNAIGLQIAIKAEDDTSFSYNTVMPDISDGVPHKIRLVLDRSANAEFFVDGVSKGTSSIAALSGKTINANAFFVGSKPTTGTSFSNGGLAGTYYELRQSVGTIYNNSGGPNGG